MLQTLEKLDRSRAASILSLAAREFLPRPADEKNPNPADRDAAAALIRELSTQVLSRRPQAAVDPVALQEALSREISSYLLGEADSATVRARVGDKGALSPSLYRVSFSPKFDNYTKFWGLSKNYVLRAIAHCDQVQHFVSKMEGPSSPSHSSLFTQNPPVKQYPYTIIVRCQRLGDALIVDEAFRVYHDEIDMIGAASPLDILTRFIEKFGEDVEVVILNADGTHARPPERAKLFHQVIYNIPRGGFIINSFPNGQVMRLGPSPIDGPSELALCFAIGYQKYADQLMRHGVKVETPQKHVGAFTVRSVNKPL
jgi:hypothetical protein